MKRKFFDDCVLFGIPKKHHAEIVNELKRKFQHEVVEKQKKSKQARMYTQEEVDEIKMQYERRIAQMYQPIMREASYIS